MLGEFAPSCYILATFAHSMVMFYVRWNLAVNTSLYHFASPAGGTMLLRLVISFPARTVRASLIHFVFTVQCVSK